MLQHYGKITDCVTIKRVNMFLPSSSLCTIQVLIYKLNTVYPLSPEQSLFNNCAGVLLSTMAVKKTAG